jgi:fermentation-respiration switch protein FrsA (DUF1100 family)
VVRLLIFVVLAAAALKALVWWLEPRMAFFPTRGVQETPAAAALPFADVRIPTADGQTLHAWWLEHPSPRAQVVFFHGNGGNLSLWLDVVVELRRRGFSVLAVDYRGYGASTGSPSEPGLYRDADAAVRVFTERLRKPGVPAVYWGRSIGAPVAAYAASTSAPDALVLESPFPDVSALTSGNPLLKVMSLFSSYRFPTTEFLQRYRGPLLVVHGDADSIIPFAAGRRVFETAPSPQKIFAAIPGADHNDLHVANASLYWRAIDDFFAAPGR